MPGSFSASFHVDFVHRELPYPQDPRQPAYPCPPAASNFDTAFDGRHNSGPVAPSPLLYYPLPPRQQQSLPLEGKAPDQLGTWQAPREQQASGVTDFNFNSVFDDVF